MITMSRTAPASNAAPTASSTASATGKPSPSINNLADLRNSGWRSRSVKEELRANFTRALAHPSSARSSSEYPPVSNAPLFPGILGYDDTVLPEIANAVLAGHDMLFLGEKGQGKSRCKTRKAETRKECIARQGKAR